jgi:hypothetical protein
MVILRLAYGISAPVSVRKCHRYRLLSRRQTLFHDWDRTVQCSHRTYRYSVKQSVTLAVVASKNSLWIPFASVNLGVVELRTRVKAHSGGKYHMLPSSASPLITVRIPRVYYHGLRFTHTATYDLPSQGVTVVHGGRPGLFVRHS